MPNSPSSSGGSDSVCQNAAEADSVKMSSFHAPAAARRTTRPAAEPLAGLRVPSTTVASDG